MQPLLSQGSPTPRTGRNLELAASPLAFSGAQKRAELRRDPCILGRLLGWGGGGGGNPWILGRQPPLTPPQEPPANSYLPIVWRSGVHESARCSMNTKGALRKILSNLHPNAILKPTLDSNAQPQSSAYSYPYT